MRHGKKVNHLGRQKGHRDALMSNLTCSLIKSKSITTTLAKAKALRKYAEPLVTKSKNDTTHSRRIVFSYLQDKEAVKELFDSIAEKVAERNGGYTRIIKLGTRLGDNAEMALIELVDFNETYVSEKAGSEDAAGKAKARRRRGKKSGEGISDESGVSSTEVVEETSAAAEASESTDEEKK
jgi:large subunit ribosomal protein L17